MRFLGSIRAAFGMDGLWTGDPCGVLHDEGMGQTRRKSVGCLLGELLQEDVRAVSGLRPAKNASADRGGCLCCKFCLLG